MSHTLNKVFFSIVLSVLLSSGLLSQNTIPEGVPPEVWAQTDYADSLSNRRLYPEAIQKYQSVINSLTQLGFDKNSEPYVKLDISIGFCVSSMGDANKARDIFASLENRVDILKAPVLEARYYYLYGLSLKQLITDLDKSTQYFRESLEIQQANDMSGILKYLTLSNLGEVHSYLLNQPDSAIYYFNQTLVEAKSLFGEVNYQVAATYARIAESHRSAGRISTSLSFYANAVTTQALDIDSTALSTIKRTSDYDSVTVYLKDYIAEVKEKKIIDRFHPLDLAKFLNLAYLLTDEGELGLAEDLFSSISDLYEKHGRWGGVGSCYYGLGNIYLQRHQYSFAKQLYERAVDIYKNKPLEAARFQIELGWVYHNMAVLYTNTEQADSALVFNQKALDIRRKFLDEPHFQIGTSYLSMAQNEYLLENFHEALDLCEKALSNQYNHPNEIYNLKGDIFMKLSETDSALFNYQKAMTSSVKRNSKVQALYARNIGILFGQLQNFDSALHYFTKSLQINYLEPRDFTSSVDPELVIQPIEYLRTLTEKIRLLYDAYGRQSNETWLTTAYEAHIEGRQLIPSIRSSFIRENENMSFNKFLDGFTESSIKLLMTLAEVKKAPKFKQEALSLVDQGKSQIVLNAIKTRQMDKAGQLADLGHLVALRKNVTKASNQLKTLRSTGATNEEIVAQKALLVKLEENIGDLLNEIRTTRPRLYQFLSDNYKSYSDQQLSRYLKNTDGALVQYFMGEKDIYLLLKTQRNTETLLLPVTKDSLNLRVTRLVNFVRNPLQTNQQTYDQYLDDAFWLHQVLIAPIKGLIKTPNLTIIPDDNLALLPFEALLSSKNETSTNLNFHGLPYLIKDMNISYASSASILLEKERNERSNGSLFLGWAPFSDSTVTEHMAANLVRDAEPSDLPYSGLELQALSQFFGAQTFYRQTATEHTFKASASNSRLLHIATHAIADEEQPSSSHLVFSAQDSNMIAEDGKLHAFEIYAMNLDADLAVLSACNTGTGQLGNGEGNMSLARAFQYAGARSVIMSLWLANDQSTARILQNFYKNLAAGNQKDQSLREAKLAFLNNSENITAHPFYWSHLVLNGDGSSLSKSWLDQNRVLLFACLLVLLAMIAFFIRKRNSA